MSSSAIQEVVCLLGYPVAGNPTQYIMEKAFAATGLDWRYLSFEVPPAHLEDAIRGMRVMGFVGANFAHPHKATALDFLDDVSEAARLIGAVNCAVRQAPEETTGDDSPTPAKFIGENTDGKGFVQSLRSVRDPAGITAAVLGHRTVARAIAVELALAGAAEILLVSRNAESSASLANTISENTAATARYVAWEGDYDVPDEVDLLVNATSIGQDDEDDVVPLAYETLSSDLIVASVRYDQLSTRLLDEAAERGCTTLDGVTTRLNQAVLSFELWTGIKPDAEVMREALEEFLLL